jgi:hypothetical protein
MALAGGFVFAEEGKKFTVTVDIDANAFLMRKTEYSDASIRQYARNISTMENLPFGGFNMIEDTAVTFSFDSPYYGGTLSLDGEDTKIGGIKVWGRIGPYFKITAGNDIGANYADSLDADPGMRIYTGAITPASSDWDESIWNESKDPDNITQDKGVLIESFIGPFTIALAGQYYDGSTLSIDVNPNGSQHSVWDYVEQKRYGYGGRLGWDFDDWGKVNVSYVNQYNNIGGNNYLYNTARQKPVPVFAFSETNIHMFGAYASLKIPPVPGLALSLGYNGVYTKYLDEFYRNGTVRVETLVPSVYKQGFNLNARYTGLSRLTLRTDNNYSFWTDRDYTAYGITGKGNYGLDSSIEGADMANVDHWFLWNGLGAAYEFTPVFKLSLYARNLYRQTAATNGSTVWKVSWDKLVGELTASFKPYGDSLEFCVGLTLERTGIFSSKEVNAQITRKFITGAAAVDTSDVELVFKIPVGMIVKLQ